MWFCAEMVYLFQDYALLGDDIVIADRKVADAYRHFMSSIGVNLSLPKSLTSETFGLEFAKKFSIRDQDLSPINCQMLRTVNHGLEYRL